MLEKFKKIVIMLFLIISFLPGRSHANNCGIQVGDVFAYLGDSWSMQGWVFRIHHIDAPILMAVQPAIHPATCFIDGGSTGESTPDGYVRDFAFYGGEYTPFPGRDDLEYDQYYYLGAIRVDTCEEETYNALLTCPEGFVPGQEYDCETQLFECAQKICEELDSICSDSCGGFYEFNLCSSENAGVCTCDECSLDTLEFADTSCGGLDYLEWYSCDTSTGACKEKTCNDSLEDCIELCRGDIISHDCEPSAPTDSNCICESDGDQDNTSSPDPDTSNPNEETTDGTETDTELLRKIVENNRIVSENVRANTELTNRELNEINTNLKNQENHLRNTNINLEKMNTSLESGFELTGEMSSLPADNVYSTDMVQPDENSLSDTIGGYLDSGLPLQQFINQSGFTVSNINPVLSCELWNNEQVDFDISPMEDILNWMGLVIFALSTISAFMIVIKR